MKRFKLHTELPERIWLGPYEGKEMHGAGELYELVETLGLVKRFSGTMNNDRMIEGSFFGVKSNRTGIYLEFDGNFSEGTGSLYSECGLLLWKGETKNRKPSGKGMGHVVHWNNTFLFEGIQKDSCFEGTLVLRYSDVELRYEGSLDSLGRPNGKGVWSFRGDVLDGIFTPEASGLRFYGIAHRRIKYLGQHVHSFVGEFRIGDGVQLMNHGLRATILKRGTRFFKFVEDYTEGEIMGDTEVYETDASDPFLYANGCIREHGVLLGRHDEFADRIVTFDASGQKTFDGSGFLEFYNEPEFVRDGYGTVFVRGLPRFTSAFFNRVVYNNVCELYDDEGHLLWALDDVNFVCAEHTYMDSFKEWPFLNGLGTVFSKTGQELYKVRFEHSKALGLKAVVALMACEDLRDEHFVDPITLDPIPKGRICVLINDNKNPLLVKSALSMWDSGPMIDPMTNVPGLRFRKVKIVANES